jgi:DNA-directed RNA polymerase subunit omega
VITPIEKINQIRLVRNSILWFDHRPGVKLRIPVPLLCFERKKPTLLPENVIPFESAKPTSRFPGSNMKSDLLEKASEIVTDPLVLVNLVSQRVKQLNSGRSPLIPTRPSMGMADIALTEIIEGKIKLIQREAP